MLANSLDPNGYTSKTWPAKPTTGAGTGSGNVRAPLALRDHPNTTPRDRTATEPRFNPYAAPQTIDRPVKTSALPIAEFAESDGTRQLFPEQTTTALAGMVRRSNALQDAQVVWFVLGTLVGVTGLLLYFANDPSYSVPAAVACTVAVLRWYAGAARRQLDRYLAIVSDSLLLAGSFYLGVLSFQRAAHLINNDLQRAPEHVILNLVLLVLIALPCLFYVGHYSLRSLRALFGGQYLFGPERLKHKDLITELAYRQESGIE